MTKPEIRKLDDGDTVVDYGLIWYRLRVDGSVIRRSARIGGVDVRDATPTEIRKARAAVKDAESGVGDA